MSIIKWIQENPAVAKAIADGKECEVRCRPRGRSWWDKWGPFNSFFDEDSDKEIYQYRVKPETKVLTGWLNVYADADTFLGNVYASRDTCDRLAKEQPSKRRACLQITRKYTIGEGLDDE